MALDEERAPLLEEQTQQQTQQQNAATEVSDHDDSDGTRIEITIGSMWISVFLAAIDGTTMATLLAPVANELRSFQLVSWVASAYLIATAAVQPLSGRLTEIFGRKEGFLLSVFFFGIGNLACGLAHRDWALILGRVVSGFGGGGLFAVQTMITTDLVPLRKRGIWQGIGNIVFGVGSSVGGAFGGIINQSLGWRYAFLIQVPIVAVSGVMVVLLVRIPSPAPSGRPKLARVDFLGAALIVSSLLCLLLGLNMGGNDVPWSHPLILTVFPLALLLMVAFIYVEDKLAREPIINIRTLLDRTVAFACITNWFTMMTIFALFFYAPMYFQLRGLTSTKSGTELMAQGIGGATGALTTGWLVERTGSYRYANFGLVILFVGSCAGFSTMDLGTSMILPPILLFLFGIGYSGMFVVALLALIAAVDHSEQAIVTAASYVFRSTGSTLGVTVASLVFQTTLKNNLWDRLGYLENSEDIIRRIQDRFDLSMVPADWREDVRASYMGAITAVWITILVLASIVGGPALGMREHTLDRAHGRNRK